MKPLKRTQPLYYDNRFEHIEFIGCGSYGEVCKVRHKETGKIYAIKKYKNIYKDRVLALRTLRELTILRRMNHPKIIKLYEILKPPDLDNYNELFVVLEYFPLDLRKLCTKSNFLDEC